jgi:alpha-glucosidase
MHTLGCHAAEEGVNKAVMREAVLMQMTWPGAPTIYYGDEAGVCGFTDPDNRRTYPWGNEDTEMIRFHKEMIRIHKERKEIRTGSLMRLGADYNFVAYGRFRLGEQTVVLVNNNGHDIDKKVSVWEMGMHKNTTMTQVMMTFNSGFTTDPVEVEVQKGIISVHMPPFSAMVIIGNDKLTNESKDSLFALGVPDVDIPEDSMNMKFLSGQERIKDLSFTDMKRRAGRMRQKNSWASRDRVTRQLSDKEKNGGEE